MLSKEQIIEDAIRSEPDLQWPAIWKRACDEALAEKAAGMIDFCGGTTLPHWVQLDEFARRAALVPLDSSLVTRCVESIHYHRRALNRVLAVSGHRAEHGSALRKLIATAVARRAQTP